ncbi:MAG: acetyl-CoA carboxylase carboxyltransferase subunit beta [Rhizobiales bacterium]|nr:acetyl-CoA carboxylase carboxyltransferase subunit beta [Hyphomicrobiales bacterium]
MNWINNVVRPKIQGIWRKRDIPEDRWVKCPETGQMVFYKDLEDNQFVIPGSNYHMHMTAGTRLASLFDGGTYDVIEVPDVPVDPLKFRDERRYTDRIKAAREATSLKDAVLVGKGTLDALPVVAAVQDFKFMGGSLGMAAGEAVVAGMLKAVELKSPFIMFAASGGARMQEGVLSLMQMPRTTVAVQALRRAKLPYVVVLTHPTTGGVTASYAMLGDVHIAEPGALIGFAGPRVIEQTIREQLPEGFQRAEFLLEHGMIDMVVHRHELRETLSRVCRLLMRAPAHVAAAETAQKGEVLTAGDTGQAGDDRNLPVHVNGSGHHGAGTINGKAPNGHIEALEEIEIVVSDEAVADVRPSASVGRGEGAGGKPVPGATKN